MRTESNIKPKVNVVIEKVKNGIVTVSFFDNIVKEESKDTEERYSYDMYTIDLIYSKT